MTATQELCIKTFICSKCDKRQACLLEAKTKEEKDKIRNN